MPNLSKRRGCASTVGQPRKIASPFSTVLISEVPVEDDD